MSGFTDVFYKQMLDFYVTQGRTLDRAPANVKVQQRDCMIFSLKCIVSVRRVQYIEAFVAWCATLVDCVLL